MKVRTGVTLIEVLVVISILAVLTAIMFPVFVKAKEGVNIRTSLVKLRQLQIATSIYQSDYDGDGNSQLGLPPYEYVYSTFLDLGQQSFKSPCGYKGIVPNELELGYQYAWDKSEETVAYYQSRGASAILFTDASCNESRAVWMSPPAMKRGLGVRLGGQLVNLRKPGLPILLSWWDE